MRFNFTTSCLLSRVLVIEDKDHVLVVGMPTRIMCQGPTEASAAGLQVKRTTNFVLKNVTLVGCGIMINISTEDTLYYFVGAVYIENCTNVTLHSLKVLQGLGTGLVLLDTAGIVMINASTFEENAPQWVEKNSVFSGGSGVHIELSYCGVRPRNRNFINYCQNRTHEGISNSNYYITGCFFYNNVNRKFRNSSNVEFYTGFGVGGGMALLASGTSTANRFVISDCDFANNEAALGGGLYIAVQDESMLNEVMVTNSRFVHNDCTSSVGVGGGVSANFLFNVKFKNWSNSIAFVACNFTGNKGLNGGGGSFYFSESCIANNTIYLSSCNWTKNSAILGAAMRVSPHLWGYDSPNILMTLIVRNNLFLSNSISSPENNKIGRGKAAVLLENVKVLFAGVVTFEKNEGSALCLDSSEVEFVDDSHVTFSENIGFQGGAITMTGHSVLKFGDDSRFLFDSNQAQEGGGAIFQLAVSSQEVYVSRTCFVRYNGHRNLKSYNTTFVFVNNSGTLDGRQSSHLSRFGHSVLLTSIHPCQKSAKECRDKNPREALDCIGHFQFVNQSTHDLSTFESNVTSSHSRVFIPPGKLKNLYLTTQDDFSNEVLAVYYVSLKTDNSRTSITTDSKYKYVSNSIVKLYGYPGDRANISLESTTVRRISINIPVVMQQCPPGYILQHKEGPPQCICSTHTNTSYPGIAFCSKTKFQAFLLYGYWVGYDTEKEWANESDLIFSYCYFGRCLAGNATTLRLPGNTSTTKLNLMICGGQRKGMFCSRCQPNYFMNYHSRTFVCRPSADKCRLGWLYYAVSEVFPATVFFLAVMTFDLRLTSSSVNGIILYMQLSDSLLIQGNGFIPFSKAAMKALDVYFLIVGVFNMEYFKMDSLSYCIWPSANSLSLLALNYVIIAYALILIIATIRVMKYCDVICFRRTKTTCWRFLPNGRTFIQGISVFLTICYSAVVKVSLLLLAPANIYFFGGDTGYQIKHRVSACDGDFFFFQGSHLAYAIPALLVLVVLGLLPPLLLLSYPLCYKVFRLLKISESRFIKVLCLLIPLEKAKPFFDSFQSGFKDNRRFFASFYFFYRLSVLVAFALLGQSLTFYVVLGIQFLLMLVFQATLQPLRSPRQNLVDFLLFSNLLVINMITIFNYSTAVYYSKRPSFVNVSTGIQVFLFFVPLLSVAVCLGGKALRKTSDAVKKKMKADAEASLHYQSLSAMLNAENNRNVEMQNLEK